MIVNIYGIPVETGFRTDNPLYWTIGAVFGGGIGWKIVIWGYNKLRYGKMRLRKREARDRAVEQLRDKIRQSQLSAEAKEQITALDLETLQSKLRRGELSALDVLVSYQDKALKAHDKTNCLTDIITEAEVWCEQANKNGLLYGVPVSLKDNYGLKGYDSTVGCAQFIEKPYDKDSIIVQLLKEEGAIPFVKTNIPQTMISFETTNPIYGATRNPQDLTRGVGGSSGGEAALIADGGSVLGFGSDIGGSIRIPSSMCGTYGFKTTSGRISTKGNSPLFKGQTNILSCYGPMARDVSSLALAMRVLCSPRAFALDSSLPPLPFDKEVYADTKPLRIGVMMSDPIMPAVPAMQRGVQLAADLLTKRGHQVVPWHLPGLAETSTRIWAQSIFADGGEYLANLVRGDTTDSALQALQPILMLPDAAKRVISLLLSPFMDKISKLLRWTTSIKGVGPWWELCRETINLREEIMKDWDKHNLDAVIFPGFTCLPLPFGKASFASGAVVYTAMVNVMDLPAGSLPVTRVTKTDVDRMEDYPTPDIWQKTIKAGSMGTEGLAVNVQVIGRPWKDEICLRLMKEIEQEAKIK